MVKKLLTFLTLLTLFFGVGWAAEVTFTPSNFSGQGTISTGSEISATVDGITFASDKGYYYGETRINIYSGGTITISSTVGNIINISITCTGSGTGSYGPSKLSGTGYTAGSGNIGLWQGSAASVSLSANAQVRITQVKVTTETGGTTTTYSLTGTGDNGTVTFTVGGSAATSAAAGATVTATATANTGYEFSSWTEPSNVTNWSASGNTASFTMPAAPVTVSATFTEQTTPQPSTDEYELVTDASKLSAGDQIIIANTATAGSGYAISTTQNTNNRAATAVTIANSKITPGSSVQILTLEKEGNNWLFNTGDGYLYAASSSSNWLRTETTADANAQATISISSNAATVTFQGTYTRNILKYNANNGNPIFSCYNTAGTVYIYKKVTSTPSSNDVYIIGQANGNGWDTSTGVQMTYSNNNDNYTADIYCTGVNTGNDEGYSFFLFAKSLPYDWSTTSNLYGSGGNGSYWGIGGNGESAFGEEIPLYEGSKDSFRLPAGLYTITVDLDYTGHEYTTKSVKVTKRDVTMAISPSSAYFAETQNVTMTSNLTEIGGKIYYTTNGNDPRDPNSGRIEYTGELTINATTTFKAVAFVGNLYSDVVEKTYTKTPAAPVINPTSCTFNEPLTVTITAEEGATIYYTTDGSNPTDQSTQYTGPFTVSGATTTVKAKAYVNGVYGATATETYTYSNVQPSTGDFVLVTSADQLVAGYEYIIVYKDGEVTMDNEEKTNNFDPVAITLSPDGTTATADEHTEILTLEGSEGAWMFKVPETDGYLANDNGGNNRLYRDKDANNANTKASISVTNGLASIEFKSGNRNKLLYNGVNTPHVFSCYQSVGNYNLVSLYYRPTNAVQNPVFTPAAGIYNVDVDVTITCATDGATIYYTTDGTEPSATNGTQYTGEIIVSESTTFKAIAVKGENSSSVVTAAYTISKSTDIETVTLTYSEPFTAGIGKFTINNESGYSPVWSLDGNYGVKGTAYNANTNPTNNAAVSRLVSPIIDMTDATQPELTFSHQINNYFDNVSTQATLWIRETSNGTSGTWVQLPITFSDPAAAGGWTNDVVDIDLSAYAGKKVQISFLYTNPTEGSGAGTWEIQNFMVADNSEYRLVNNIAEFLALENGTKAKFKNPVTVLYDYAQYSSGSYHEYIWVKDNSGYMQFYLIPTLNSSTESNLDAKAAYYENGDIIPAGFVVVKNYYENGKYVQAYSAEALEAGFEVATQKGLADPDHYEFSTLNTLTLSDADIAANCNRYISIEKIKIASKSGKNFTFANESGTENACVGYNKYNGDGSLLKDGENSADVTVPDAGDTYYNVKGIIQIWQGGWEFMPVEFTEWKIDEVTLRELCQNGVENNRYTISNRLQCVYIQGNKLWVKDDNGQSIHKTTPASDDNNYEIGESSGNTQLNQSLYDQSNWLEVQLADGSANAQAFYRHIIKGGAITGTFTNKTNPTMENVVLTSTALENSDEIGGTVEYAPNYYCAANFYNGIEGGNQACTGSENHGNFFFMNPKPQEYVQIDWAQWDGTKMIIPTGEGANEHGFNGEFEVNMSMNSNPNFSPSTNTAYKFEAIVRMIESTGGNTLRANKSNDYIVYPLNLSDAVVTGINNVTGKAVAGVKYYNLAGMESDRPFEGVSIIVTTYTDGSRSSAKVLK